MLIFRFIWLGVVGDVLIPCKDLHRHPQGRVLDAPIAKFFLGNCYKTIFPAWNLRTRLIFGVTYKCSKTLTYAVRFPPPPYFADCEKAFLSELLC